MAADVYSTDPGDYGMPNTSNGNDGPTGIPDPNNPGYDTNGYPLPGRTGPVTPTPGAATTQGPGPAPAPGPDEGGGSGGGGGLVAPFTESAPSYIAAPGFTPPSYAKPPAFNYADFVPTTGGDVLQNDPSYGFRLQQGEQSLQNSAAAGGVLNTGNTLKDILGYGQNFASQEFGNVDARRKQDYSVNRGNAVGNYNTNYQTQYVDPYKFAYQGALDTFAPQMADWSAQNGFNWQNYLQDYTMFRNRQRDSVDAATALG